MTTQTDYTEREWDRLTQLPTLAAFGAMAAEEGGPVTSTRELWGGMQELAHAAQSTYQNNTLIQEITRSITHRDDGSELTLDDWKASGPEALNEKVVGKVLATAREVRKVLADRATPEEATQYTAWIMGIARAGVHAAKTGFLGLGGSQVTPRETQFLSELGEALEAPR